MSFDKDTYLCSLNTNFIEQLYQEYLKDPHNIAVQEWRELFASIAREEHTHLLKNAVSRVNKADSIRDTSDIESLRKTPYDQQLLYDSLKAFSLAQAYYTRGHLYAKLDPLQLNNKPLSKDFYPSDTESLDNAVYHLTTQGMIKTTVRDLLVKLQSTYCSSIGAEFVHISDLTQRRWLQEQLEKERDISHVKQKQLLHDITQLAMFENFLHKKYPGAKRFSIEGGEGAIVVLEEILRYTTAQKAIIGMAHRGRLNVLVKILGKKYATIFKEFRGNIQTTSRSGDVKYHLGFTGRYADSDLEISLNDNPSHLEAVNAVAMGTARAAQDKGKKVLTILLHGDASFAGQGVVYESLNLSGLQNYTVNGVIHIVINNQIGFTTNYAEGRPSSHASDIAKYAELPILHVNGNDPEAIAKVSIIASEFHSKFAKDVVIDVVCYRKYGHNEGDEPRFTQPIMYEKIAAQPSLMNSYAATLVDKQILTSTEVQDMQKDFHAFLESEFNQKDTVLQKIDSHIIDKKDTPTGVENIRELADNLTTFPSDFNVHDKLRHLFATRKKMFDAEIPLDWGAGEALAFATLLSENISIRLAGQDSCRGTFAHRHAVVIDQKNEQQYIPLNNLKAEQGRFTVINSPLSEYAAMGFEYGYSLNNPQYLTLWEGQFGDFANGAQIIIDQFLVSAEEKWLLHSNLVLLLPHGYEGQGPEHSSGRLERFLQLCAYENIQVVNCSTPANYFHVLRRQAQHSKPLIIFTPKSLLRHKLAVSSLTDFTKNTRFMPIIPASNRDYKNIERVIMCSGKVYYDLLSNVLPEQTNTIAIIRLEQLYPFPSDELHKEILCYKKKCTFIWCQEEPQNMGAWSFIKPLIDKVLLKHGYRELQYCGRKPAASPAVGYLSIHNEQQKELVNKALG